MQDFDDIERKRKPRLLPPPYEMKGVTDYHSRLSLANLSFLV